MDDPLEPPAEGFDSDGGPGDFDEDPPIPLDRREAARVRRDLDDLAAFRSTFEPEGLKGVSLFCPDCVEQHFYAWEMLEHNLEALLESGETPVHEPAYDPDPEEYVDWEYAQGYLDGLADGGRPVLPAALDEAGGCPHCGGPLPAHGGGELPATYCPSCGSHLGFARIARALLDRGWSAHDVAELLRGAGAPPLEGPAGR